MVKITADVDRRRTVSTCVLGTQFPAVNGRLLALEASGRELAAFLELHQVPIMPTLGMTVTWSGRGIGHALRRMRELFVSSAA